MYRKTYIEIDTNNLKHNVSTIIKNYPDYKYYIGVVKGNVYGHGYGAIQCMIDAGINYLAVSSIEEAICIRNENINLPILCLQPIHIDDINDAIRYNITITISNYDFFKELINYNFNNQSIKVHIKVNSGFNRLGISDKNHIKEIFDKLKNHQYIKIEGIFSHFATNGVYEKHWDNQLSKFKEITSLINLNDIPIVHFGKSLTLIHHNKIEFCNGIRLGTIMYGHYKPSFITKGIIPILREIKRIINSYIHNISNTIKISDVPYIFKSAFSLYSEIIEIREINKGAFVGYGAYFIAENNMRLAYLPIGYSDGFSKKNKNGYVYIKNKKYKIICIDMGITTIIIDNNVDVYDKVEIVGNNISVFNLAIRNNSSTYEILCEFKESIPRIIK